MSSATRLILLVILALVASLAALSATSAAIDIMGDWDVGSDTVMSGETIHVRGNVTIHASLTLTDCWLIINGTSDGYSVNVTSGGSLVANGCTIGGHPNRIHLNVSGDTTLANCTVRYLHGYWSTVHGLNLWSGSVTIRDTLLYDSIGGMLMTCTDLVMDNVTMSYAGADLAVVTNMYASSSMEVSITGCTLDGTNQMTYRPRGIVVTGSDQRPPLDLTISLCSFGVVSVGVVPYTFDGLTMVVEDCTMNDIYRMADIEHRGGNLTLRRVTAVAATGTTGQLRGVDAGFDNRIGLVLRDLEISGFYYGIYLEAGLGPDIHFHLHNVSVTQAEFGVKGVKYGIAGQPPVFLYLTIDNSSFTSTRYHFNPQGGRFSVYDTVHDPGSAAVMGADCYVKGYARIAPECVRWFGGPVIGSGAVRLFNGTGTLMTTLDAAAPGSRYVLGWEKGIYEYHVDHVFVPEMDLGGRTWKGRDYQIWGTGGDWLEILDDVPPTVTVAFPRQGDVLASSSIACHGDYAELGSGMARVEYSMDDGPYGEVTSMGDGKWLLSLPRVTDGLHGLRVRGVDRTGGVGLVTFVGFSVDTGPPSLELDDYPAVTNVSRMDVRGWTEVGATVTVDGEQVVVLSDGSFRVSLELQEGDNLLEVRATDPQGNVNSTTVRIVLDTTPPSLDDLSPANGTWTRSTLVVVEGTVDAGDRVWLLGRQLTVVDGSFREELELEEGEWELSLLAIDAAGNRARRVLVVHVDLTPPHVSITSPDGDRTRTRFDELSLEGQVDDAEIGSVLVNGESVTVHDGWFGQLLRLSEGENAVVVVARDLAGNEDRAELVVVLDTVPPIYTTEVEPTSGPLVEEGDLAYVLSSSVMVRVLADETVTITAGEETLGPDDQVTVTFDLVPGTNRLALLVADLAGNEGQSFELWVVMDDLAPVIDIESPAPDLVTKKKEVIVRGTTEVGSTIVVNGVAVTVLPSGLFQATVALDMGDNDITIEATDMVGHTNSTTLTVRRKRGEGESGPPVFSAVAPVLALILMASVLVKRRGRHS